MASVYLILAAPDSGQYEIVRDLIEEGIDGNEAVLSLVPENEVPDDFCPNGATVETYRVEDGRIVSGQAPETGSVFIVAPATADPVDMAEALKHWIHAGGHALARVITIVHCAFLKAVPAARAWYDACIHFSDVVVLNRRDGVDNNWHKTFQSRYEKEHMPCLFLMTRKGQVGNPFEITTPEARRLSLYFDEPLPIEEDGLEDDDEDHPEDLGEDLYIERLVSGRRAKEVPGIEKLWAGFPPAG